MSIDEAIIRMKEAAMINREHIGTLRPESFDPNYFSAVDIRNEIAEFDEQCAEYAKEHEQIAEWLEELKAYRKEMANIRADTIDEIIEWLKTNPKYVTSVSSDCAKEVDSKIVEYYEHIVQQLKELKE